MADDFKTEGRGLPARSVGAFGPPHWRGARDVTDELADPKGRNQRIYFYHVPSGDFVSFKAFIKVFTDVFTSNWNSEPVYGRMDPIQTFQSTTRIINLEWDIPSIDIEEAKLNLAKADKLINMLYPTYLELGNAGTVASSPLFKLKFANLIRQPGGKGESASNVKVGGLVGRVAGFSYAPEIEHGFFSAEATNSIFYPQTIKLACEFHVLHTHSLGWRFKQKSGSLVTEAGFPHGGLSRSLEATVENPGSNNTNNPNIRAAAASNTMLSIEGGEEGLVGTRLDPETGLDVPVFSGE